MSQAPAERFNQALSQHPVLTDLFSMQIYLTEEDLDRAGIHETKEQEEKREKGHKPQGEVSATEVRELEICMVEQRGCGLTQTGNRGGEEERRR